MKSAIAAFTIALCISACAPRKLLIPINRQSNDNLSALSQNISSISAPYPAIMSAYLDFKIQQQKVSKQVQLGSDITPEQRIQLEFFVRDQQAKKNEIMALLGDLIATTKSQITSAQTYQAAYQAYTEGGKFTTQLSSQLSDADFQRKLLSISGVDATKAARLSELLSDFSGGAK